VGELFVLQLLIDVLLSFILQSELGCLDEDVSVMLKKMQVLDRPEG
jgi:hypothetical protein